MRLPIFQITAISILAFTGMGLANPILYTSKASAPARHAEARAVAEGPATDGATAKLESRHIVESRENLDHGSGSIGNQETTTKQLAAREHDFRFGPPTVHQVEDQLEARHHHHHQDLTYGPLPLPVPQTYFNARFCTEPHFKGTCTLFYHQSTSLCYQWTQAAIPLFDNNVTSYISEGGFYVYADPFCNGPALEGAASADLSLGTGSMNNVISSWRQATPSAYPYDYFGGQYLLEMCTDPNFQGDCITLVLRDGICYNWETTKDPNKWKWKISSFVTGLARPVTLFDNDMCTGIAIYQGYSADMYKEFPALNDKVMSWGMPPRH